MRNNTVIAAGPASSATADRPAGGAEFAIVLLDHRGIAAFAAQPADHGRGRARRIVSAACASAV
ncbi:MAG TPA: hypothetical protein VEC06_19355 [Paucimonas sp.]|nr:hypothetical protein [Paucimonas sp.]